MSWTEMFWGNTLSSWRHDNRGWDIWNTNLLKGCGYQLSMTYSYFVPSFLWLPPVRLNNFQVPQTELWMSTFWFCSVTMLKTNKRNRRYTFFLFFSREIIYFPKEEASQQVFEPVPAELSNVSVTFSLTLDGSHWMAKCVIWEHYSTPTYSWWICYVNRWGNSVFTTM